ncbi:MAG: AraC family transcriptional regulator, partial [Oscillospiraceae bacterium]|nr:AraC family transcriptional regulator [Oscillospiraceae bacterium]
MGVVEQIKNYVTSHLQQPISAKDISVVTGYSRYHAMRLFKAETGESPFEYIRRQRMLQSAYALRHEHSKVVDVAFDYVFESHEGFTRAFSHTFGITPKKYANLKTPD